MNFAAGKLAVCMLLVPVLCASASANHHVQRDTQRNHRRWAEIAKEAGTDKFYLHWYHRMYEELLEPFRHRPITFLEIGLGCDQRYGPGKSFLVWEEYFTHADTQMYYIEIDGACVAETNIQPRNGRVFVGSQDNITFLEEVSNAVNEFGGLDVLVDDGGHTMTQQLHTWAHLWPRIRPNGLFIVEDIQTSYIPGYGGSRNITQRNEYTTEAPSTFIGHVFGTIDALNCDKSGIPCDMSLKGIHIYHHAAAFTKASPDTDHVDMTATDGEYIYPSAFRKSKSKRKEG